MGKTSLTNTFAEFLKSPTERPIPVLTKGTDLEFTKVMQLYDGLSVNQKEEIVVQVEDLPQNGSVKLVKLKMAQEDVTSSFPLTSSANKGKMAHTEDSEGASSFQQSVVTTTEKTSQASPANQGTGSPTSKTSNKGKMAQSEDSEGTSSFPQSVLTTEKTSQASPTNADPTSKTSGPTFGEAASTSSVSQKVGKRERFKKFFASLFTRGPNEILEDEEDKEKEESEDDIETRNQNQGTPAKAPGETSYDDTTDDESPSKSENDNKNDVQLKLVDMGGHSATVALTSAVSVFEKS